MNFKPELFKWYLIYMGNNIEDYRLFYLKDKDVLYYINVKEKCGTVEKGYDILVYIGSRGSDYRLAKLPRFLQKSVMAYIFEELK